MDDDGKTKDELRAELNALQRRIAALEGSAEDDRTDENESTGVEQSKRNLVRAGWVAPVILAVNLPTAVFAGSSGSPGQPTPSPTDGPTRCARELKEDIDDAPSVLDKVETLPIHVWRYRDEVINDGKRRMGPMADDFNKRFMEDDHGTIDVITALGVCMKAIQEVSAEVKALKAQIGG